MLINLYEVLSVVGREETVPATFHEQEIMFASERMKLEGVKAFDVCIKCTGKDVVTVYAEPEILVIRPCSRCLEDVETVYPLTVKREIKVSERLSYTDNHNESEEISYIEDCTLDVDMLVLDELYTLLPMNVLCKEDCKGICKVCGTNLNKSTCNCDQTVPNPRMAVFSDIFNQFKEV